MNIQRICEYCLMNKGYISSLMFVPNTDLLVVADTSGRVYLFDHKSKMIVLDNEVETDFIEKIRSIDSYIYLVGKDNFFLWNTAQNEIRRLIYASQGDLRDLSPDGKYFADAINVRSYGTYLDDETWLSVDDKEKYYENDIRINANDVGQNIYQIEVIDLTFSSKNNFLAVCIQFEMDYVYSLKRGIIIWDVDNEMETLVKEEFDKPYLLEFSPDDDYLAYVHDENWIGILDIFRDEVFDDLKGHRAEITSMRFSRKGDVLATSSEDNTIRFWDWENGKEIYKIEGISSKCVAFNESSDKIAIGDFSGRLMVFQVN